MNPTAITSLKPTSQTTLDYSYFCSIDKCDYGLRLLKNITTVKQLKAFSKQTNSSLTFLEGYFKNKKARVEVKLPNGQVFYLQTIGRTGIIHTITTNPSGFSSFYDYWEAVTTLLGESLASSIHVKRIDFAVDFLESIETLSNRVDVLYKRVTNSTSFHGSKLDWLSFGKRSSGEFVKLYEKTNYFKCGKPVTRLEIQLTSPKLPKVYPRKPLKLFKLLRSSEAYKNFKTIKVQDYELLRGMTKREEEKYLTLKGALKVIPKPIVRRRLNGSGNFLRDYKKIIKPVGVDLQFWIVLNIGITQWIEKSSDYEDKH